MRIYIAIGVIIQGNTTSTDTYVLHAQNEKEAYGEAYMRLKKRWNSNDIKSLKVSEIPESFIRDVYPPNPWIFCTDLLPQTSDEYIVWYGKDIVTTAFFTRTKTQGYWLSDEAVDLNADHIIAWQPMPDPPIL
jgi:hypothetical protein